MNRYRIPTEDPWLFASLSRRFTPPPPADRARDSTLSVDVELSDWLVWRRRILASRSTKRRPKGSSSSSRPEATDSWPVETSSSDLRFSWTGEACSSDSSLVRPKEAWNSGGLPFDWHRLLWRSPSCSSSSRRFWLYLSCRLTRKWGQFQPFNSYISSAFLEWPTTSSHIQVIFFLYISYRKY